MSKRKTRQDSEKLDRILVLVEEMTKKVEWQNRQVETLQKQFEELAKFVEKTEQKNRKNALLAGGVGGGIVAVGFELLRLKLGG